MIFTIIHRYIAKSILQATIIVVMVVMGLAFFINLLGELKDIGVGDYTFLQAVLHALLRLPYSLYQFFPMLALVGSMMGLGALAANRELIVMRASGFSIGQVLQSVMMAAILLILFATIAGECLGPQSNFMANSRKDSLQNSGQAVATASGVWIHEGNNFLHIDKVMKLNHLEGISRYEFDTRHQLIATYFVKRAMYTQGQWHLIDIVKTTFAENHTVSSALPEGQWDLALNPNLLNVGLIAPEEMSLRTLSRYSAHLKANHLQANNFQFEFWKRIFQPLITLVMILLAIPFIFGSPRSVTMGWRILLGVIVGFVFYIVNAMLGQFSVVYQFPPILAALLPTLIFGAMGYVSLKRVK